ncbi:choice-of-anchor D domain-containing protein [Corallococcus sp. M34]|uniref:choice-of-anchor D domain-containing protein n=1 Tax=Citreicoccus inhibens TaxID=2849499 RepID=UPI001C24613A|nr:choice-of-anchor D domain-containing protein [Citreicoccus inhibens]MBU8898292.1 choice-of-anchor D domain-containing protein [Citreicoccus inhibens]
MRGPRVWAWVAVVAACMACGQPSSHSARTAFEARPESLEFGVAAVGRTKTLKLRLANGGRAPYRVEGATSNVPHVQVPPFEPFTLSAGAEQEVEVRFTPDVEGDVQGQVQFLTDADGEASATVPVSGRGVKATLEVPEAPLDFGNVGLGQVETLPLTLRNTSAVDSPLELSLAGSDADEFSVGPGLPAMLSPGESRQVTLSFEPTRLGAAEAELRVTVCTGCEPAVVPLKGTGVASLLEVTPLHVDFGRVAVGATAEERITVRNQGTEPLRYTGASLVEDPGGVYRVVSAPSMPGNLLPAGGSVEVRVAFTPLAPGAAGAGRVLLDVGKAGTNTPGPKVSLTGEGGGSCVAVLPDRLDFGVVASGMTATRQVEVLNHCRDEVLLSNLAVATQQGGYFTLAQPPASTPIPSGQSLKVGITFSPRPSAAGGSAGQLGVTVRHGSASSTQGVALLGEGQVFSPCVFAVPPTLDFGGVQVGTEVALGVTLRNTGTERCYLASMSLASGSDVAFSAEPVENGVLAPGQKATLVVRFKPDEAGDFSGMAEAWLNHPTLGHPLVALAGKGVQGCFLVQPGTVDFGTAKLSCGPRTRDVVAINQCSGPVSVSRLGLEQVGSEFEVKGVPALPLEIAAGGKLRMTGVYEPVDDGADAAALRFTLPDGQVYTAGLVGRGVTKADQTDVFFQESEAKVDVLFVVDNSGSMMEEQQSLGQNFAAFLSAASKANVDFRIGVTTTGLDPSPGGWSECPGGAQGGENGRLFPADGSSPRIITPTTPNAAAVFANNTKVGVCHWNEQGLDAAYRALSEPLLSSEDDIRTPLAHDGNAGFLRDDAKLAIIALSDEEDFSSQPVSFYESYFLSLKGQDKSRVSFNAVVGPPDLTTCPTASSSGSRYAALAQALGGVVDSICTPDWATSLEKLSLSAFGPNRNFPLSARPADTSKIVVKVDGVVQTGGWSYDAGTNTVVFDSATAPAPGAMIEITYPLGCD